MRNIMRPQEPGTSTPLKLRRALLEKSLRALPLVFRPGAEPEERSLKRQALALARLQAFVHRFERELHGERGVGKDLLQDRFGARDEIGGGDDLVDETDAVSLLRADYLAGEDELQGATLPDQPRQALRTAATRKDAQLNFGLAELRVLCGHPDGAGHRRLASAAEREA